MFLLKGGNIHTESGEVKNNSDLLFDNTSINKIGKNLAANGAEVLDVSGMEVFAGFIAPCTSVGLVDYTNFRQGDQNEDTDPLNPHLNVKYALDKREIQLQQYHYSGITSFGAAPGPNNIISGQMGVYHTAGESVKKMCIKEFAAIKGSFSLEVKRTYGKRPAAPMTKMGMASMLRNALIGARDYMNKEEKEFDEKNEGLVKLLQREVPLLMNARSAAEISGIISIAREFDLRLVLHNVYQPDKCAAEILENNIPVLLGQPQTNGYSTCFDTDFSGILEMVKDGAVVGLSTSGDDGFSGRETLLWGAIRLVQAGADVEEVIKMLTINNARALGVEDLTGSLKEGKQADIVVYNRHPLKTYAAQVEVSIVAGEVVYKRTGEFEKCCL